MRPWSLRALRQLLRLGISAVPVSTAAGRHSGVAIATSSDFGIDTDAKEAIALLGYQT